MLTCFCAEMVEAEEERMNERKAASKAKEHKEHDQKPAKKEAAPKKS